MQDKVPNRWGITKPSSRLDAVPDQETGKKEALECEKKIGLWDALHVFQNLYMLFQWKALRPTLIIQQQ